MKIYLASPFFTEKEIIPLEKTEKILRSRGFDVFSPREHEARSGALVGSPEWSREIFEMDKEAIHDCDCLLMLFHGLYSDSGTAWECGYAYAIGKPVIVVHLGEESNIMIHEGCHTNITAEELYEYDFGKMEKKIYKGKMK